MENRISKEILISDSPNVLSEIQDPKIHTVSWDISTVDEFQTAISANQNAIHQLKYKNETAGRVLSSKEVQALNLTSITKHLSLSQENLINLSSHRGYGLSLSKNIMISPPKNTRKNIPQALYSNSTPHIDKQTIAVFVSFNKNALGTACIPREFAGEPDAEEAIFFNKADKNKAIYLPAASISIIDLGQQVHYKPESNKDWRIFGRMVANI